MGKGTGRGTPKQASTGTGEKQIPEAVRAGHGALERPKLPGWNPDRKGSLPSHSVSAAERQSKG